MFLIRCFRLEREYDQYIGDTSAASPPPATKPRSNTLEQESKEVLGALPCKPMKNNKDKTHGVLARSVSAGIYEDDIFLVNYQKYGRDGVPYVFDDRKTRTVI